MWSLPPSVVKEFSKSYANACVLLELLTETPIHLTNLDLAVGYAGEKYIPYPFEVEEITQNNQLTPDRVSIKIDNVSNLISGTVLNKDIRGEKVNIYWAIVDDFAKVQSSALLFSGFIDSADIKPKEAKISVIHEILYLKRNTLRQHFATCPWRFKDENCKYSGQEKDCDKTFSRCQQLGNTAHFGGFKYLSEIEEKEIRWGRK